jgi:hypothetical protein
MELFAVKSRLPTIVVVDDFLENPDKVREFAMLHEYSQRGSAGLRSKERYQPFCQVFADLLQRNLWFDPPSAKSVSGVFQYCTAETPRVYHSDLQSWAGALYLTPDPPPDSGLTMWRHRELKLRYPPTPADAARLGMPLEKVLDKMYSKEALFNEAQWEQVDRIGNVYNRLVLWPGKHVHSASSYFGESMETARLFQIFFFEVQAKRA